MKLYNFNTIYNTVSKVYGLTIDPTTFEDVALFGWEQIGNRHTQLYRYITDVQNGKIELPCNVDSIESVTIPLLDAQMTSNLETHPQFENQYIERYIESHKWNDSPVYQSGKLIKYREEGDTLLFDKNYKHVCILYHGIIVDEDGLPLLNDKEIRALAAFVVYSDTYKQALMRKDGNLLQLAQVAKADWVKSCTAARISDKFSQNDMDSILDVKVRWDRKAYGKSYKPIV